MKAPKALDDDILKLHDVPEGREFVANGAARRKSTSGPVT